MKKHPEFRKERERLLLRRDEYKNLIQSDIHAIKESLNPLAVAKNIIGGAIGSFRDNGVAVQGSRLALSILAGRWSRRPWVGVAGMAVSTLLPLLLRNLPRIVHFVRGKTSHASKAKISGK